MSFLILPGLNGSGPNHWQTLWEQKYPDFKRLEAKDWSRPICREWVQRLENEMAKSGRETVLVAHSLACLQVVHWASDTKRSVRAAFLVAPPNPNRPDFPSDKAVGFTPLPEIQLPFPSMVIASTNDPYATIEYSESCALQWGSIFVNIGNAGHINAASKLGDWAAGFALLQRLLTKGQ